MEHIIFYDGNCSLCQRSVAWILSHDKKGKFLFSKLDGQLVKTLSMPKQTGPGTLVLLENYKRDNRKFFIQGKAVFKILLQVHSLLTPFGILFILPKFILDPCYRFIAKNRLLFLKGIPVSVFTKGFKNDERFLP